MMSRRPLVPGLILSLALLAAACSPSASDEPASTPAATTTTMSTSATTTTTTTTTTPPAAPDGRLVVLGLDGNVFTIDPDGSERIDLTIDAAPSATYFQPVWSPDGTAVAFGRAGPEGFSMTVADQDGSASTVTELGSFPFYYYWDAAGERVGLLRNAGSGLDLAMEVIEDGVLTRLETGAPFYFSWEPDGSRLVWHIGSDRLEIRQDDASLTTIEEMPGLFQAPQWTRSGVYYSVGDGDEQVLVRSSLDGSDPQEIGRIRGFALFSATRDGTRVAVQGLTEAPDAVAAAAYQALQVPLNQVAVIDVASGTLQRVTDDAAQAFFWNPGGDALLALTQGPDPATLTWHVWRDGTTIELVSFTPTLTFLRDFLPFFDQYAQSMTLWSPDGASFAFPGVIDNEIGIWIQSTSGGDPVRVAEGFFVSWSPV